MILQKRFLYRNLLWIWCLFLEKSSWLSNYFNIFRYYDAWSEYSRGMQVLNNLYQYLNQQHIKKQKVSYKINQIICQSYITLIFYCTKVSRSGHYLREYDDVPRQVRSRRIRIIELGTSLESSITFANYTWLVSRRTGFAGEQTASCTRY